MTTANIASGQIFTELEICRLLDWLLLTCVILSDPFMIIVSLLNIFLIRRREVLFIRLLSGENTEWSKYVLNVAKMWIKEIRF